MRKRKTFRIPVFCPFQSFSERCSKKWIGVSLSLLFLFFGESAVAQITYPMQNLVVEDCEGILTDSDEGIEEGQYAHNEDYIFTICIEGATEITVVFDYFATEANHDVLSVFDGPDVNSPLIAELSGTLQPPPALLATSGCITFHFVSDDNIAAIGWQASWSVEIIDPEPPALELVEEPVCPMTSAVFQSDVPISCTELVPANFSLVGPVTTEIVEVNPLDCDPDSDGATQFELQFSPPAIIDGNYRLFFDGLLQDNCGNFHEVQSNVLIAVENCPFSAIIELENEPACAGDCTTLLAIMSGGSGVFNFEWSHSGVDSDRVDICSDEEEEISLLITDLQSGNTAEAIYNYIPLELPEFLNPLEKDTFCASRGDHFFQTSLPGGNFFSSIIPEHLQSVGRYQFWRWRNQDPINEDVIEYVAPNGCSAFDTVFVKHIRAGDRQAACLGADAFTVSGGFPDGGYWSGPHVDSSGLFTPEEEGSFLITYHAPNNCAGNKRINVGSNLTMPDVDTICSSERIYLEASIYGGRWFGPGIINRINGRLDAWQAPANQTHTYTYILEGCEAEMEIYIRALSAGPDQHLCASDSLLTLPVAGDWSGPGTYLSAEQAFDVSSLSAGEYTFTLHLNNCSSSFTLYKENVGLGAVGSTSFCLVDHNYGLGDLIWVHPWGGVVEGPGVFNSSGDYFFNPATAGPGEHDIVYEALGCRDSIIFSVEAPAEIDDLEFCDRNNPTVISAEPGGGHWTGPGFLDGANGLFDPQSAGVGEHPVQYTAPSGCITETVIVVSPFEQAQIMGLNQQFCFQDTFVEVNISPPGGVFTINGEEVPSSFNPSNLGSGTHEFRYSQGTGECASSERRFVTVLNPIGLLEELTNDTICRGENTLLEVIGEGGLGSLTYFWDNDLGFGNSQIVFPTQSQWFRITIEDQCSVPFRDSVFILVNAPPEPDYITGSEVCFEDSTFAEIIVPFGEDYQIEWQTDPVFRGPRLMSSSGIYTAIVEDQNTGCVSELTVRLPGPGPLKANFSTIPNQDCIDLANNQLEIINLSFGWDHLLVDFGDGSGLQDFTDQSPIRHFYEIPGNYWIEMIAENELGCSDTIQREICVKNIVNLYIPNAFSPNGDGLNDFLEIYGLGVSEDVHWQIFDRYGSRVFYSESLFGKWDGRVNGSVVPPGVYILTATYSDAVSGKVFTREQTVTLLR